MILAVYVSIYGLHSEMTHISSFNMYKVSWLSSYILEETLHIARKLTQAHYIDSLRKRSDILSFLVYLFNLYIVNLCIKTYIYMFYMSDFGARIQINPLEEMNR